MLSYLRQDADAIRARVADADADESTDGVYLIYAVLARAKGSAVTPEDVHDAWAAWTELSGRGDNRATLVPYDELDPAEQARDLPYVEAIHAVAAARLSG